MLNRANLSVAAAAICAMALIPAAVDAQVRKRAPEGDRSPARHAPKSTTIDGGRVSIGMLRAGHIPAVMATVNGEGPFLFAVDTGASGSLHIDSAFAAEHGFPVVDEIMAKDGMTGKGVPMSMVEVGALEIGGARFEGVVGMSRDYSPIATALGSDMVGIIGFGLFSDCVLTVDFPKNRLVIESDRQFRADDYGVVPLVAGLGIADVPIVINGTEGRTHIDTGARGGVTIARDLFDQLEFSSDPLVVGQGRTVTATFDVIQADLVGELTIAGFPVKNPSLQTTEFMDHGNVGVQLLSNFAITFDQRNSLARFARPRGAGPVKIRDQQERLGIKPSIRGDLVVLEEVIPGSPAEQAGLLAGDRIVEVNGKRIEDLRGPALGKEMRVRPTIRFVVERDGQNLVFSVTI